MRISILTLFPEAFAPLAESLIKKAREKRLIEIQIINLRDFTTDKHRTADDAPYGGGSGMVLKIEPIAKAISRLKTPNSKLILMCPSGKLLTQERIKELAKEEHLIIICGHYEGVDERVRELVDEEISIGDYVLTGGELPAMVLVDAMARYIPGVVKEEESVKRDSFSEGLLDYPSYTKPEDFEGKKVPEVLLSGDHAKIEKWRRQQSLKRTFLRRPDLLAKAELSEEDRRLLEKIIRD